MLNRAINIFDQQTRRSSSASRPWQTDQQPRIRIVWLCALFFLILLGIAARLVHLQLFVGDQLFTDFDDTTESFEPIPSRDGRILAADGQVLADDRQQYHVLMHYRWLEEPANKAWLRQQALSRLGRADRWNKELVDAEVQIVSASRKQLQQRLAELTDTAPNELHVARNRIQKRIQKIHSTVLRRREQNQDESREEPAQVGGQPAWWQTVWQTVVITLTTSPDSDVFDPLVVQEEESYHQLIRDVPREAAMEIEAHPERFPGVRIAVSTERFYPHATLAAHVIGTRISLQNEQIQQRRERFPAGDPFGYQPGDRVGTGGVEQSYERRLRGQRGLLRVVKNRQGEIIYTEDVRQPRLGQDVTLTLNPSLQQQAETLLDQVVNRSKTTSAHAAGNSQLRPGGCIVVLDIWNGDVLAAASAPRFDLNQVNSPDDQHWQRLLDDPRKPFFSRPTHMELPPGSVFKVLTSVALLENGLIDPDQSFECRGYLHRPDQFRCYIYRHYGIGHGGVNLSDAICRSCNVYFFAAAEKIGPGPIQDWASRLGFGRPTGIDLPGERSGNLPLPPQRRPAGSSASRADWHQGDTRLLAIGQSRLTVTPMQIVQLMAAVANDGYLVTPRVAQQGGPIVLEEGSRSSPSRPQARRIRRLSPDTLQRVREGMERVVSHSRGTGHKFVHLDDVAIAGKTGTAEVGGGKQDHAWFAGYVPADQPRYAFVVVLQHAGSGGREAGPVARNLVRSMLQLGLLPSSRIAQHQP